MRVFRTKYKFLRTWETESIAEVTHQLFDIGCCQFLNESGGAFFDAVTNMAIQENMNSFVIGFDTADISMLAPTSIGNITMSSSEIGKHELNEFSTTDTDLVTTAVSNETTDFSVKNYVNKIKDNFSENAEKYGRSQVAYFTHQESKLRGISTDLTNLISNIKGGVTDLNELYHGNVQGAGLINLARELGDTSFGSITNRSTLDGNEPSLSLDTKQL